MLLVFSCSVMSNSLQPLSFTISWSLLKLMSIELVMPSNHLILVVPLSSCFQSFPASGPFLMSQLFASGGQSIGASALVLPSEYSGLISFRIDWFDFLTVQETLKSLLQNHGLKGSKKKIKVTGACQKHTRANLKELPVANYYRLEQKMTDSNGL